MKKIIRLTESDLMRIVKRVISEQKPDSDKLNATIYKTLTKLVNGKPEDYLPICKFCREQNVNKNNDRAKKAALEFKKAITGLANPFDNFILPDKDSPAQTAGKALYDNLKSPEDICAMISYYDYYTGSGELFEDALNGEINWKVDPRANALTMFSGPVRRILDCWWDNTFGLHRCY